MIQLEPAVLVLGLAFGVWVTSRVFFRRLSPDRAATLRGLFHNLSVHLLLGVGFSIAFVSFDQIPSPSNTLSRIVTYVGLAAILFGATVFVKTCRILVFEYFFLSYKKAQFPVLLVNLISLVLSMTLATWILAEIFNVRLTPLLATSAIFSLVLGLALQDTLGNLFAGVALQLDKPYGLGDWIEVHHEGHSWAGQIHEISWRATLLVAFTDEFITVPNRVMSQAKISNYSIKYRPISRSQIFRIHFGADIEKVKKVLLSIPPTIPLILQTPAPRAWILDTSESWVAFKLLYHIDNFGAQYRIADQVYSKCLVALEKEGFRLATHQISYSSDSFHSSEGANSPSIKI